MLFNSIHYLLFLPIVVGLFYQLQTHRKRLWLILFASFIFYAYFIPKYLLILFLVIGIDYFAALKIEKASHAKSKKFYLSLSLLANLSILGFFKYTNFLIENWNELSEKIGMHLPLPVLQIILPIGLSFHTFQSMAYIFEVYYGRFRAEKDLLVYSIYVLYFPQLVAGPIERPQNIIPQLKVKTDFDYERSVQGLYLIAMGLIKKVVIADTLAMSANRVFDHPESFGAFATLFGVLCFAFQIYTDFSGYSDIARGSSRLLGIEMMLNFNRPYFARSISEFWRRWHISLSTWFRDYLYIPLGGSRGSFFRTQLNLLIVFMVSGLWHGANWTFVIWGSLHGAYLIFENTALKKFHFHHWPKSISRLYVLFLVLITWVFFRANSITHAMQVFNGFMSAPFQGWSLIPSHEQAESLTMILVLVVFEAFLEKSPDVSKWRSQKGILRWGFYVLLGLIYLFFAQRNASQFIYFQF